jgi:DNA repair exonuclease SbcCD ATPase subunit
VHGNAHAAQHAALDDALDEDACQARLVEAERRLRRRDLAAQMARDVRARIARRVLPETEAYMRALLPELTAGRYRDVELLREDGAGQGARGAGGADLRIRVWDQWAGRYVAKGLFSGGARDQVSLALRLAFALATLPKELGAMPGFIFLDEPLSAFDAERSAALERLLTRGVIARQFPQVFLISHSQTLDPAHFDYRLRMAAGRIVETNLPGA